MFEFLVYRLLYLLAATHEAEVEIFQYDNGAIFNQECRDSVYDLRQITFFQLLDALYRLPALSLLHTFVFAFIQQRMIISITNFVERELFADIAVHIRHDQIQQIAFSAVDAYDMNVVRRAEIFPYTLVDPARPVALEIEGYRDMELKFVHSIASVFDQIVVEQALFFVIPTVFVFDRNICRMRRTAVLKTLSSEEQLCSAVELIYDIR